MISERKDQCEIDLIFSPARIVCFGGKLSAYILCHQKLKVYLGIEFWEGKLMDVMEIKNILEFDEILKSF